MDALRIVNPQERHHLAVERRDVVEALRARTPVGVVGERGAASLDARALHVAPQLHEARRVRKRQRAGARRVDEAEDRRVRADADREREHGDERKAGRFAERPERVAYVLHQRFERIERPHVPALLLQIGDVPEPAPRGRARIVARALTAIGVLAHRHVKRELVVQIALEPPPAEQGNDTVDDGSQIHGARRL